MKLPESEWNYPNTGVGTDNTLQLPWEISLLVRDLYMRKWLFFLETPKVTDELETFIF